MRHKKWTALGVAALLFLIDALAAQAGAAAPEGWGPAWLLEASDVGLAYNVRVATDGDGVAMYTWSQTEGAVDLVHARRYDAAFGWGETSVIQTDGSASGDQSFPVMDAAGNAMVLWVSQGAPLQVWAARFAAAEGWAPAVRLDIGVSDAARARAAVDPSGNVMAVWQQSDGTKNDIWANRYVVGSGWGTPATIESSDGGAIQPSVAADGAGNMVAVWAQIDAGVRKATANRFVAGTGWGTASTIESGSAGNASLPYVDTAADGRAVAVWATSDGTRLNSWSAFFTPGSGWGAPGLIETDDAADIQPTAVGVDDTGKAIALLLRCSGSCEPLAAHSSAWGTWEGPQLLSPPGASNTLSARLGMNARGQAVAIWPQETDARWDIWASPYTPSSGWKLAERIETDNRGNATTVWMAVDEAGNAFASWDDYDGAIANAWANVYLAPVAPDTALQDRIDALEDRLTEQDLKLQKADQDLDASNDNVVALTGQLATLSILATVALLAAIAGIGLTVVQLRRAGKPSPADGPVKEK